MKNRIEQIGNGRDLDEAAAGRESLAADLEAAERNRSEAFLAFHAQNHNRLSAFVHTLVPAWQDAEEIVQDTLVVLWRKFDEFDPSTSFFAWAAKVAQYEVLNYRRKNRAQTIVLTDTVLESLAKNAVEQLDDLELHREALEGCIKKLDERDRELVSLRYRADGNIQSTAEAVHRTKGHVQRMLRRIRAQLLRCIHLRLAEVGL